MICGTCGSANEPAARACSACGRALEPQPLAPGSLIASRYEVMAPLGAGGMGQVVKAHDRALDEDVALKLLRAAAPGSPLAARLRSEIKLARKVRHRNVCAIHEYGEDGDLLFISMELVHGRNLREVLRHEAPLAWEQAYEIALQACEGLDAIHEVGVIHRDLKPANIMRDDTGRVLLLDFGIAVLWKDGGEAESLTGTGQVVGSPEYMSPEQIQKRRLDFRSDVYSLGVVIYELFTGRVPFRGDTPVATMLRHLQEAPALGGEAAERLPPGLAQVLRRALAKAPAERYPSCRALAAALREARAGLGAQATDAFDEPPAAGEPGPVSPYARLLVPALSRGLRHTDPGVRRGAALALARVELDGEAARALGTAERGPGLEAPEPMRLASAAQTGSGRPVARSLDGSARAESPSEVSLARPTPPATPAPASAPPAPAPQAETPPARPPAAPAPRPARLQAGRLRLVLFALILLAILVAGYCDLIEEGRRVRSSRDQPCSTRAAAISGSSSSWCPVRL